MRRKVLAWTVDMDPAATRAVYRRIARGAAVRCGCLPCRNFHAARPAHFAPFFRQLLATFGVDPRKEFEVRWVTPVEGGRHLYAGAYVFVGEVVTGRPYRGFPFSYGDTDVFERISPEMHVALRRWMFPQGPWKGLPCVRLEFLAVLPWVLEEPGASAVDLGRGPHRPVS